MVAEVATMLFSNDWHRWERIVESVFEVEVFKNRCFFRDNFTNALFIWLLVCKSHRAYTVIFDHNTRPLLGLHDRSYTVECN